MSEYFAIIERERRPIELVQPPIGSGGEANIYRVEDLAGCAAKIYHGRSGSMPAPREKLQAMLARPPEHIHTVIGGKRYPLFAWPTHLIEDGQGRLAGYLMPEMPAGQTVSLETYLSAGYMSAQLSLDDRSLPRRVQVCSNLASAIAEMHRQQHYFVDLKPANIFFFKDISTVCLVDNDSFSIAPLAGGKRFAPSSVTSQYGAPELLASGMSARSVVDDTQDRFALAVMIFQILNQGAHPFQGVPKIDLEDWDTDLCVREGYYPHGRQTHPCIDPAPWSIHDCLSQNTLDMFEKAFTRPPNLRPSAAEWRDHLRELWKANGTFTRCAREPKDVLHIHFSGKSCPECRLMGLDAVTPPPEPPVPPPRPRPPPAPPSAKPKGDKKQETSVGQAIFGLVLIGAALYGVVQGAQKLFGGSSDTKAPVVADAPMPSQPISPPPAPTPVIPAPASAATGAPPPAPSPTILSDVANTAHGQTDPDDSNGINARVKVLNAVLQGNDRNRSEMLAIAKLGLLGNDAVTFEAAKAQMRDDVYSHAMGSWQRFVKPSRQMNEELVRTDYRANITKAVSTQTKAFALNPWDREVTGNLAFYLALADKNTAAMNVGLMALSLPRPAGSTGRSADWQLVGSMLARQGRQDDAKGAFLVGLAITQNLAGFCKSLLIHHADFGDSLKAPIDAVFKRIDERGQSSTENCAYPPVWKR